MPFVTYNHLMKLIHITRETISTSHWMGRLTSTRFSQYYCLSFDNIDDRTAGGYYSDLIDIRVNSTAHFSPHS